MEVKNSLLYCLASSREAYCCTVAPVFPAIIADSFLLGCGL